MAAMDLIVQRPDVDADAARGGRRQLRRLHDELDRRAHRPVQGGGDDALPLELRLVLRHQRHRPLVRRARSCKGSPRDQIERYWQLSPLAYVEKVTTPILILHGEQDLRCPQEQAEQWFVSLRRLGKTAEFVRFPEESHDLSRSGRPDRRLLRLERIVGWFERVPERVGEGMDVAAPSTDGRPRVFGHRGAMGYAPE